MRNWLLRLENMNGIIIIRDHAKVTAYGGNHGAAIGSEDYGDMTGKIIIVGNAIVNTGVVDDAGNVLSDRIGYIGDGKTPNILAVRDIISLDRT